MPINSFFFDFDGTLQGFETHSISASTKEALHLLKAKNNKIFLATGRNLTDIPETLSELNFDGFINNNGGMCSDENRIPFHIDYISKVDVKALLQYDEVHPFAFSFMTEKGFSINRVNDFVEKSFEYFGMNVPKLMDAKEIELDKIMQMNFFVDEEQEERLMKEVMINSESSRWMPYFADVNPKGINKMKGIERMAKHYNLDLSKTMAFGDGGNDIPMINGCAIGVAMGNSKENVQNAADYVTTSADEDGIWNALKYYDII
ncbi:Cof-type HAD-IIB family hydrolase [Faecalibacter macacae]|uniref:Cof-type HAD-IIB family hydrolase n=1 Tax=Faecalibacter macacae TaxID=1859289 RepID=A0A3L9MCJ6_9FLAO|nr:Cof-type HAD-IIB family hydrolase [Faecalibacter macacae]RLZ10728.1 Cof-type HAD-IIB family hydrolase [Faecalibacter macacae]